jgi:hypothetical protein
MSSLSRSWLILAAAALSCLVLLPFPVLLVMILGSVARLVEAGQATPAVWFYAAYTLLHPVPLFAVIGMAWARHHRGRPAAPWLWLWLAQVGFYLFMSFGPVGLVARA